MDSIILFESLDNIDITKINLECCKMKSKSYTIDAKYESQKFKIQGPLCKIEDIEYNNSDTIKCIHVTFKHLHPFFQLFDLKIKECIESNINMNIKSFVPGQQEKNGEFVMKIKVNGNTKYYNEKKKPCSMYDISVGDHIVAILFTKGIFLDENCINYRWTGEQILILKL